MNSNNTLCRGFRSGSRLPLVSSIRKLRALGVKWIKPTLGDYVIVGYLCGVNDAHTIGDAGQFCRVLAAGGGWWWRCRWRGRG